MQSNNSGPTEHNLGGQSSANCSKSRVWMENSSATDHNCKFVNNTIFMFQIVNDSKSVPFALTTCKTVMYTPQSNQKAPTIWQIMQNSPTIFPFALGKMELPKFTANCTKSAQFADPC